MNVNLLTAWQRWLSGETLTAVNLWGLPILWWGRIGLIAQFVAALTIATEIIGPERLRAFGKQLHGMHRITSLRQQLNFKKLLEGR